MSSQLLNAHSRRRIQRDVGGEVICAWANGGWYMRYLTADHQHGWWDKRTREHGPLDEHFYPACEQFFPGYARDVDH